MRRILSLLVCITLLYCVTGCAEKADTETRTPVTVNMPADNTVNGYRTSDNQSSQMPETVSGQDTAVGKYEDKTEINYCANKNSKVFHKPDCTSVEKTKKENRVYFSDREELIKKGYTPCKRCNP